MNQWLVIDCQPLLQHTVSMDFLTTTPMALVGVLVSIVMLWRGADLFVDSASSLARLLGLSELVIGLTFVALGTSAPEFAVSVGAAFNGQSDISVSNVVGSNVFNLGFILGGCALVRAIPASTKVVYRDGFLLIGVSALLFFFVGDGKIGHIEGLVFIGILVGYLLTLFVLGESPEAEEGQDSEVGDDDESAQAQSLWKLLVGFIIGGLIVVLGSKLLVGSATILAKAAGWSDWQIGVTVVAAGTSAPELATSLQAVLKNRFDMSVGALVGSDLFNLLGVLGVSAAIHPLAVGNQGTESVALMVLMIMVVVVMLRSGWRVSRLEGAILVLMNCVRWWFEIGGVSVLPLNA